MNIIKRALSKIPDWLEIIIVLTICFGMSIYGSIASFTSSKPAAEINFDDSKLISLVVFELFISGICIIFLWLRDYKIWEKLSFEITFIDSLLSLSVLILSYLAYAITFAAVFSIFGAENISSPAIRNSAHLFSIVILSLINPLFEEVFVVGYFFDKMKSQNVWLIILASALLRTSYHLYQGWLGIISILPIGLIFAFVYSRRRNLWILYLAHALMDLIGLMQ